MWSKSEFFIYRVCSFKFIVIFDETKQLKVNKMRVRGELKIEVLLNYGFDKINKKRGRE